MSCDWKEKLSAFHDGELPSEMRREAEAHAENCVECALELKRFKRISRFLKAVKVPAMTTDAFARLRDRLGAERERLRIINGRRTVQLAGWLTAAAAAVMLCCSAALYSTHIPPANTPTAALNLDVPLTADLPVATESEDPLTLAVARFDAKDDGRE